MKKINEIRTFYNATELSKLLGVHYKTIIDWWRKGKLRNARRSEISNEILIPVRDAQELLRTYGFRQKSRK